MRAIKIFAAGAVATALSAPLCAQTQFAGAFKRSHDREH
jgi:hypothetical protein